jgi:hypothetical protein
MGIVIEFELTSLGEETIIQATCYRPELADYFEKLWNVIMTKYFTPSLPGLAGRLVGDMSGLVNSTGTIHNPVNGLNSTGMLALAIGKRVLEKGERETATQSLSTAESTESANDLRKEPWKLSRPNKQARDKIIWEMRQSNDTWENIAERADCGISTAKENYDRMQEIAKKSG